MSADSLSVLQQQVNMLRQVVSDLIELQGTTPASQSVLAQLDALRERVQQMQHTQIEDKPLCVKEMTVERLNVVEPDGTVRLVLCNTPHSPGHVMDDKVFGKSPGEREAGVYFFDDEGNECGGLIYGGKREGNDYYAGGSLTFDQYRQDQVIGFQHQDYNGQRLAGLRGWDRPNMPLDEQVKRFGHIFNMPDSPEKHAAIKQLREMGQLPWAQRVFVGKDWNRDAVVYLYDAQGRVHLRLCVDAEGTPKLEFLDENGAVFTTIPNQG